MKIDRRQDRRLPRILFAPVGDLFARALARLAAWVGA